MRCTNAKWTKTVHGSACHFVPVSALFPFWLCSSFHFASVPTTFLFRLSYRSDSIIRNRHHFHFCDLGLFTTTFLLCSTMIKFIKELPSDISSLHRFCFVWALVIFVSTLKWLLSNYFVSENLIQIIRNPVDSNPDKTNFAVV
jgi:hypothetical protein